MQLTYIHPPTGNETLKNQAYIEYPKFVHFTDGRKSVIVADAEEEAAALAGKPVPERAIEVPPVAPIPVLVGGNDEEAMLRKIAAEKGIRIDGRWKLPRIRRAVEAASG